VHAVLQNFGHAHLHTLVDIGACKVLTEKPIQQKNGNHASQKNHDQTQSK
jgi:hypothetical protein